MVQLGSQQSYVSGSLQCPKGVPQVTGVMGSTRPPVLQGMRIGFMVSTTLDARLTLSVKSCRRRSKNEAEMLQDGARSIPHP